ncbi:MAG: T9SS type A sorting domain-containing protein [Bacteroidetes bacterium]|nr:T9SS type A sorting domain-containing protein [Bacteroidota bacterium]
MKRLVLVCLMFVGIADAQNFWSRIEPYSYGLNEIRFGGGDTVFGTWNSGFSRSTNNGDVWSNPVIVSFVQDIHVVPNGNIFLAQNQDRLSRSTNRGASWTKVGNGITPTSCSSVLANAAGVVVTGTQNGIFRSTDNGTNFTRVAGPAQLGADTTIGAMATYDGTVWYAFTRRNSFPEIGYALRSTDAGLTWTKGNTSLDTVAIYKAYIHPNGSIFTRTNSGIRVSSDGGNSWYRAGNITEYIGDIAFAPDGTVYTGMTGGNSTENAYLFRSTDLGNTWTPVSTPSFGLSGIHVNGKGELFLSQDQTYRSSDQGATWKALPVSFPNVTQFTEGPTGELFISAGGSAYQNLYRSQNNGFSWTHVNCGVTGIPSVTFHADTMIVADNFYPAKLFRSTDNGVTFKNITGISVLSGYVNAVLSTPQRALLAATTTGIFRSVNHGKAWTNVSTTPSGTFRQHPNGTLYAFRSFSSSGVFRSTDDGATWTEQKNGMGNTIVHSLAVAPNGDLFSGSDAGLFRSTDAGSNWVRIDTQKVKPYGIYVAVNKEGTIFFGGAKSGTNSIVYRSTNAGISFTQITPEISAIDNQATIRSLFTSSSGHLFAGTSMGLFRSQQKTTAVTEMSGAVPEGFRLDQNYPNPFNPVTTIRFHLAEPADVRLTVYDPLGREVRRLTEGRRNAGTHTVPFDAADLASGVYYYTVTAGSRSAVKRMLLVK